MVECDIDRPLSVLGCGELAKLLGIGSMDKYSYRFSRRVRYAAELWPGDQVEQCLLDRGHPAAAEFGLMSLDVEPRDVAAYEKDLGLAVGELHRSAMMPYGDYGNVDRSRDGVVYSCGADSHECGVVDVVSDDGDGQRCRFKRR